MLVQERTKESGGSSSLAYSSASASANAYANAGASAFSLSNAFTGIGSLPTVDGSHDGHKGIRSYDNTGYNGNNQPNGGVKGNQRGGCPKCKWEDDDYWEKDEDETEPEEKDEDDCDDGDDGQYREHGHYHGHKNKGGSPPGVQKLGVPNSNGQGPHNRESAPRQMLRVVEVALHLEQRQLKEDALKLGARAQVHHGTKRSL